MQSYDFIPKYSNFEIHLCNLPAYIMVGLNLFSQTFIPK